MLNASGSIARTAQITVPIEMLGVATIVIEITTTIVMETTTATTTATTTTAGTTTTATAMATRRSRARGRAVRQTRRAYFAHTARRGRRGGGRLGQGGRQVRVVGAHGYVSGEGSRIWKTVDHIWDFIFAPGNAMWCLFSMETRAF